MKSSVIIRQVCVYCASSKKIDERYLLDACLLYTSDAADERSSVDLGGRRIIKKKKKQDKDSGSDTTETIEE